MSSLKILLLIGAQKAGTTAISAHIAQSGVASTKTRKERNILNRSGLTQDAIAEYARGFEGLDVALDATTLMSMRTAFPDAAENAKRLAQLHEVKVLYLVRHPWTRLVSQFYHLAARGIIKPNLVDALGQQSDLVFNSLYNFQIEPWLEALGEQNILLLSSENYFAQPREYLQKVADHVGAPMPSEVDDPPRVNARNDTQTLRFGALRQAYESAFFQNRVRPVVPGWVSRMFRQTAAVSGLDESCPVSLRAAIEAAMAQDLTLLADRSERWAAETEHYLSSDGGRLASRDGGS